MNERRYAPALAQRFVAVGQLQTRAARSSSSFLQERFLKSADSILRGIGGNCPDPDLLSLGDFSASEVTLAIGKPRPGESLRISILRRAGEAMQERGRSNSKGTVRRRAARQRSLESEPVDPAAWRDQLDNRLDCHEMLRHATPQQQKVLKLRLDGVNDTEIAGQIGMTKPHVAVLAHRGHIRIRNAVQFNNE